MLSFGLLLLLILPQLILSSTKEIYCNVFSYKFEEVADRCIQTHEAVSRALWSSKINKYILDEAFGPNSRRHPPTAMIINYKVRIIETKFNDLGTHSVVIPAGSSVEESSIIYNGQVSKRSLSDIHVSDTDDKIKCESEKNCTISIGWSSASVYTFIRPKFMLSLQPAWFLSSLNFSIHQHFWISKRDYTIHLHTR